jgi:hypothetical protein
MGSLLVGADPIRETVKKIGDGGGLGLGGRRPFSVVKERFEPFVGLDEPLDRLDERLIHSMKLSSNSLSLLQGPTRLSAASMRPSSTPSSGSKGLGRLSQDLFNLSSKSTNLFQA